MPSSKPPGLKQRIQAASTATEIDSLLTEGSAYTHAAPGTRRAWDRAAARRREDLAASTAAPVVTPKTKKKKA